MATRTAHRDSMIANLSDDAFVTRLSDEAHAVIYGANPSVRMAFRTAQRLIEQHFGHIGDAADRHSSWVAGRPEYSDVEALLSTDNAGGEVQRQISLYAVVCAASYRIDKEGTEVMRDRWGAWLDEFSTLDALDGDPHFGALREKLVSVCVQRSGGAGGASAGGGAGLSVRVHQPKLLKMPSSIGAEDRAGQYRHLLVFLNSDGEDQTEDALQDALIDQHKLAADFKLFVNTRAGKGEDEWKRMTRSERVVLWLQTKMKQLDADSIATSDLEKAMSFKMTRDMSVEQYLTELGNLITTAKLSYRIAYSREPAELASETEECKLIVDGLLPKLKTLLKSEHSTVLQRQKATGGALPGGYAITGFTDKNLVSGLAKSFASDHHIDGGGGQRREAHGASEATSALSAKTTKRLNRERAAFVGIALESGHGTPEGYGMVANEVYYEQSGTFNTPYASPCLNFDQLRALTFPPLLIKKDGKKASMGVQICKFAWRSQKCPNPDDCGRRHISKDEFIKELQEGTAPAQPVIPKAREQANVAADQHSTAANTADDARIKLLEEQVKSQTETLLMISGKMDSLLKAGSGVAVESEIVRQRKAAAAQRRAMLAGAMRDLHAEETAIAALGGATSEGHGEAKGSCSVVLPVEESFWSDSTLEDAGVMLPRAKASIPNSGGGLKSVKTSNTSGLPLSTLRLGDITVIAMWDTGCSPSALVTLETLYQWIKNGAVLQIQYFSQPKTISGVSVSPVLLVGTVPLPLQSDDGRSIVIQAGVMSNGSTGACDVLVGNYHMRHDWDYKMDSKAITLFTPPDGGGPLSLPIDWRMSRDGAAQPKGATHLAGQCCTVTEHSC